MMCVILGLDPGKRAGWCVRSPGGVQSPDCYVTSGAVESHAARCIVIGMARSAAEIRGLPLIIVAESHTRFGRWGASAAAGTAAAWGHWQVAIEEAHLDTMPPLGRAAAYRGVVRVLSDTWYRALIGPRRITAKRDERLRNAMLRAGVNDPDEAVARCIAEWSAHAEAVRKVLPAAFRKETR